MPACSRACRSSSPVFLVESVGVHGDDISRSLLRHLAVGHARDVMRMRMLLDTGTGQLTECTGSPEQAQALADSRLDTVTGACLDYSDSPFNSPGQPCTASFLDSLACRNAVATRRHLPRLAWLHRAPDELRGTVDAAVRAQDWRTHFLPLTAPPEDNPTTAERDAA